MVQATEHLPLEEPLLSQRTGSEASTSSTAQRAQNSTISSSSSSSINIQAPSMTGVDLEEFHFFPRLVPELRVMIWKFTFPGPRVISLTTLLSVHDMFLKSVKEVLWTPLPPTPIALHINRESRLEALKSYEVCVGRHRMIAPRGIYVNFAQDIFWAQCLITPMNRIDLPVRVITERVSPEDLKRIQRVMMSEYSLSAYFRDRKSEVNTTGDDDLESLKELIVESDMMRKEHRRECVAPECEFIEEEKDKGEEEEKDEEGGGAADGGNEESGQNQAKKALKALRNRVSVNLERAQKDDPKWKAPILKFGRAKKEFGPSTGNVHGWVVL